ncbi:MAG: hypothetical protein KY463_15120, partial [Actinobacteria bacterium]|nr:hypothetical protein [Actinomycetota bacterium]
MRKHRYSRAGTLALATLGVFAAVVPTASADTALPVWTCRASAGYLEVEPLLDNQRVEPVLANGFPIRGASDSDQCASSTAGVDEVSVPGGAGSDPLLTANAAFARTAIDPQLGPAREQDVSAAGGVTDATITLGDLVIRATVLRADAAGTCNGQTPTLSGSSTVASLQIGATTIPILNPSEPQVIPLLGLATIYLNRQVREGDASAGEEALTQRAIQIELLPTAGNPAANIVLGEAKVDRTGAVCAPAPPPPTCPAGYEAQPGGPPLVCLKTETNTVTVTQPVPTPCGQGTTANAEGVCVVNPVVCPRGTIRDPASNTCVLVRERPCPQGATADPATRVCVVRVVQNTSSGENGRIGSSRGPRATCGRINMFFVRGGFRSVGRSFTSRFGTRTVTRGRLVTCGANPRPIVGARVDVVHVLPDGRRLRKTGLRSRSGGKLTLILPMDLRTRRIEYGYRPDLRSSRVTSRVTLRL